MHDSSLIRKGTVATDEGISSDSSLEDLYAQYVLDDFFCRLIDLRVYKGYMVIRCDDITQGRESFFNSLNTNTLGE